MPCPTPTLIGVGAAGGFAGGAAEAAPAPVAPRTFTPQALPFNPASITGLSEKLLVSHHDNS